MNPTESKLEQLLAHSGSGAAVREADRLHAVQFYETERYLDAALAAFALAGLSIGQPLVVFATEARRSALRARLSASGIDVAAAEDAGRITFVDAHAVLSAVMVGDSPDAELFHEAVGSVLADSLDAGGGRLRVYGEMVDLLWREGRASAAMRIEELWNELAAAQPMQLLCAYSLDGFAHDSEMSGLRSVCAHHDAVLPAESYTLLGSDAARQQQVVELQQRARSLESEVRQRRALERALRSALGEHRRIEQELAEARDEAERASRAKTEFLAVMSHELRTPLNAIMGYDELLALGVGGTITAEQRAFVDRIRAAAEQLLELVNQILNLSRIESGKEEVRSGPVDVAALAREACTLIEPAAMLKDLSLSVDAAGPLICDTDEYKLRQILLNLLSNAVKFTATGTIEVTAGAADGSVHVSVADTGCGIAASDLERVFNAFVQVDNGRTRTAGGTGLGLAVSRDLARLLGGDVTVASEPGRGSRFTVRLPARGPRGADA